jgi:hypothetical protein
MNPLSLIKTIAQTYYLMTKRCASYGEPVHWTDAEVATFLYTLPQNPLMQHRFALAASNKRGEIFYQFNTEKLLGIDKTLSIDAYYRLIHIDYLEEYLRIAPAQLKITLRWVQIIKNIPIFANICFAFRAFQNLYRRR